MKPNLQQQKAITHSSGPLLIVAGAGTGKTSVITKRVEYLLTKKQVDSESIFVTTFTQKSAEEIIARLDTIMPLGYHEPWIGTFHGLCQRILRHDGLDIGIDPNFEVMSQTDQWLFIKEHLFDFHLKYYRPLGNPTRFISAIISLFSRLQDEAINDQEFMDFSLSNLKTADSKAKLEEANRLLELAHAFSQYQALKYEYSKMDYGDLITKTASLLADRPNLQLKLQSQFKHILVDEFQDTNYAQFLLIRLLAPQDKHPNLIVVGDDDQSIYKFRGASVSNILTFKELYPQAQEIVLTHNYRSDQKILDAAYKIIINNNPNRLEFKLNINKQLTASKTSNQSEAVIHCFDTSQQEVDWTISQIQKLIVNGLNYQDIAILARSNAGLDPYIQSLKQAGIPFQTITNRGLFDQTIIKELLYFLEVIIDPSNSQALFQLAHSHSFNIKSHLILSALVESKKHGLTLWDWLGQIDEPPKNICSLLDLIKSYRDRPAKEPASSILFSFIESTNLIEPLIVQDSIESKLAIENLNRFFKHLQDFERVSDDPSAMAFMQVFESWLEAGQNPGQAQIEDIDTVSLMTVHASKGLEFEAVFLGGLIVGRFPSSNRKDPISLPDQLIKEILPTGDVHIQEERRLFYVAMTRAKSNLYLTHAADYGGTRKRKPTGFLKETGLPIITHTQKTISKLNIVSSISPQHRYLKSNDYQITKISYSQIDTFNLCPLKYKYRYLLKVPAQPHHSLSFGRTIHQTLHQFHLHEMQGKPLDLKGLLHLYESNFIPLGYDSVQLKQKRFEAGVAAMKQYFSEYKEVLGKPIMLEQQFRLKLDTFTLIGTIDRIDTHPNQVFSIVDYKTGQPKDQNQVDKDNQLTIYALAADKALDKKVNHMSLYFIEADNNQARVITTTRNEKQQQTTESKLIQQIKAMQTSTFEAKPSSFTCSFCEYKKICPFSQAD